MIGCIGYNTTLECLQYVNDVQTTKYYYFFLLLIYAILIIYFSKSKNYKIIVKKYSSFNLMLKVPIWFGYVIIFILLFMPIMLSIQTTIEEFMKLIWAIIIPLLVWAILFIYLLGYQWLIKKIGFKSGKSFLKAIWKK